MLINREEMSCMDVIKIIEIIASGNLDRFYKSGEWLDERNKALRRDNNECQKCKSEGRVSLAQCVHHIKHLKTNPELALDINNLISLCNSCHNVEHPEKLFRGVKRKKIEIAERW